MFEKRADQLWILADLGELLCHALLQLLAFLQRVARIAGALGMAPYQLIRIQFLRMAGQEVQRQSAFSAGR